MSQQRDFPQFDALQTRREQSPEFAALPLDKITVRNAAKWFFVSFIIGIMIVGIVVLLLGLFVLGAIT